MSNFKPAPTPENETDRLAAVKDLEILDTEREESFDLLAEIAAAICETEISAISIIDSKRQWFKAHVGMPVLETPRDISFCGHAIMSKDSMVIDDLSKDTRFAGNPLVVGDTRVRFYAGAPIFTSNGFAIGTVCALDLVERKLSNKQILGLQLIAKASSLLFDMRSLEGAQNSAEVMSLLSKLEKRVLDLKFLFGDDEEVESRCEKLVSNFQQKTTSLKAA